MSQRNYTVAWSTESTDWSQTERSRKSSARVNWNKSSNTDYYNQICFHNCTQCEKKRDLQVVSLKIFWLTILVKIWYPSYLYSTGYPFPRKCKETSGFKNIIIIQTVYDYCFSISKETATKTKCNWNGKHKSTIEKLSFTYENKNMQLLKKGK